MTVRAPVHVVHVELEGIGRDVARFQTIIFKALIPTIARPDKNEDYADHKKHIRQIGLFKGQLEHF